MNTSDTDNPTRNGADTSAHLSGSSAMAGETETLPSHADHAAANLAIVRHRGGIPHATLEGNG